MKTIAVPLIAISALVVARRWGDQIDTQFEQPKETVNPATTSPLELEQLEQLEQLGLELGLNLETSADATPPSVVDEDEGRYIPPSSGPHRQ